MASRLPDIGTFGESGSFANGLEKPAVAKTLVSKQELALIALQEIRNFPGSEHVASVEVDHQIDNVTKTNWTLHVFTSEGANMERIQFAINTTRKRLRHRYDLRPEFS
jgi:hypothetical protein